MQKLIHSPTCGLDIQNEFLSTDEASALQNFILQLPLVKYPKGKLFGKEITFHRWIGFFTNSTKGYRFSGQSIKTEEMTTELQSLTDKVNAIFRTKFNGVLVNVYTSGQDYISAHSDNEKELGPNPTVAAISLGQTRSFRIRDKHTKKIVLDVPTQHGQLLVMSGDFQARYTHEIPIEKNKEGCKSQDELRSRVSLTFRTHDNI